MFNADKYVNRVAGGVSKKIQAMHLPEITFEIKPVVVAEQCPDCGRYDCVGDCNDYSPMDDYAEQINNDLVDVDDRPETKY